jgi:uncharacterized protein (DUF2267 family)
MAAKGLQGIDETVQVTHIWLGEIAEDLGSDKHAALGVLRAVLHAVRDRLEIDESAQFSAQLPLLVRGMYFESWDPHLAARSERGPEAFLAQVQREAGLERADAEWGSHSVSTVISRHVSAGEWSQVLAELPRPVRELLA